jgi:hypothetical protein
LAAVARALPLETAFKHRYKRLTRFLDNRLFDPPGGAHGVFGVVVGLRRQGPLPGVLDQSTLGAVQLRLAGVPFAGRVLPRGLMTFTYEDLRQRPSARRARTSSSACSSCNCWRPPGDSRSASSSIADTRASR